MSAVLPDAPILLEPYNPEWPSMFAAERATLAAALARWLAGPIEFCKPGPALRTHHLHLVPFGSERWRETLAFRERLRESPRLAEEYLRLKRHLAQAHPDDREAYTDGKSPFIQRVLRT